MEQSDEISDALVMWGIESCERLPEFIVRRLQGTARDVHQTVIGRHREARPPHPIFYAPIDTMALADPYLRKSEGIVLVARGTGPQDSVWQTDEIVRRVVQSGIQSCDIIGVLPLCIKTVADVLAENRVRMKAWYLDGGTEVFEAR